MRGALSLLVTLSALAAGCVGGSSSAPPPAPLTATPAQYDELTGGIEGLVTDEEIQPVAGALIGLVELPEARTQTDDAGKFSLSNLQPGVYTLAVNALGYEAAGKKVDVAAGSVTPVQIVLPVLPILEPYGELIIHRGKIENGLGVMQTATCSNCGSDATRYTFRDGLPLDWVGLMIEVQWDTNDFLGIDFLDRANGGGVYWRVREASPVRGFVERCGDYTETHFAGKAVPCKPEEFEDRVLHVEDWYVGGFQDETHMLDPACPLYRAGCYGIGYIPELVFTNYLTVFHMALPDDLETYSAVPDA